MIKELLALLTVLIPVLVKILNPFFKSNRLNMNANKFNMMIMVIFSITALVVTAVVVLGVCYIGTIKR